MLSRDLVGEVRARMRPVDDPILQMLVDPRRARTHVYRRTVRQDRRPASRADGAGLRGRGRRRDRRRSMICGRRTEGRWRLQAGGPRDGGKPSCERTTADADLDAARRRGGRRLPRRHPAGRARGGRADHRAQAGRPGRAVDGHVVGSGSLVPHEVLTGSCPAEPGSPGLAELFAPHFAFLLVGAPENRRSAPLGLHVVIQRSRQVTTISTAT